MIGEHAFEALRLRPLGFHPIVERPNAKVPLRSGWQRHIDRSAEEVSADFKAAPEGCGIGTVTAGFVVVDVDERPGVSGEAQLVVLPPLPETLASRTPSGGRHLFFKLPPGVTIPNSVGRVSPGIDIRGTGGQVVLPPTTIDGRKYEWLNEAPMAELPPAWLALLTTDAKVQAPAPAPSAEVLRRPGDREFAARRAAAYLATMEPSIAGQGGHNALFSAACRAVELCLDEGDALDALRVYNDRAVPPWEEHELQRKLREALKVHRLGERFDAQHEASAEQASSPAASPGGPPINVAERLAWVEELQAFVTRDRDGLTWHLANPLTREAATRVLTGRGMAKGAATAALDAPAPSGPVYAKFIDCNPSRPATFTVGEHTVLNNYVPPTIAPAPGVFPVIDEVLSYVTAGDEAAKAWLVNWMAFAIQHPAARLRTVPVLYGAQMTGKSLIARVIAELLGKPNCANIRNEDIKSRFNVQYVAKLFVHVSEIEAGEVTHATSTLKYLTGEPELMAEAKGVSAFQVKNRLKLMCTSNQTLPVHVEGNNDTRWVLFRQLQAPPADYQARMKSLFDSSGDALTETGLAEVRAFGHFLANYPVDEVAVRTVFASAARADAVAASRSSVELFADAIDRESLDAVWTEHVPEHERTLEVYKRLDLPERPELTGASAVHSTYKAFCRGAGLQPLGAARFPGELARARPTWLYRGDGEGVDARPNVATADGRRCRIACFVGIPRDPRARPPTHRAVPFVPPPPDEGEPESNVLRLPLPAESKARGILARAGLLP